MLPSSLMIWVDAGICRSSSEAMPEKVTLTVSPTLNRAASVSDEATSPGEPVIVGEGVTGFSEKTGLSGEEAQPLISVPQTSNVNPDSFQNNFMGANPCEFGRNQYFCLISG